MCTTCRNDNTRERFIGPPGATGTETRRLKARADIRSTVASLSVTQLEAAHLDESRTLQSAIDALHAAYAALEAAKP